MKKRFILASLVVLSTAALVAKKKPQNDPIMPDVTARGRALYAYDQAAWHATDAVQAEHPAEQAVGRYIARNSEAGWKVAFGHLNAARDKFLVAYEATQGAAPDQFVVKKLEPPEEDTSFCLVAARAIDTALHDFHGEQRPYNVAVLPADSSQLYVYVIPAQTENGIYPLGGDARYLISADGNSIVEKRQLHKTIIENREQMPNGATAQMSWHTHVLSNVPEDTDVFYVLTRRPSIPEMIGTPDKKLYQISTDGTIFYAGKL